MGKRIIVLSDGTGNSAAQIWRTNVWRIFESLDLKQSDQIAVYDDGVGTSSFKPMALLGGAFGFGLKRNVLGLYKFLCRNYKSKSDYEKLAKPSVANNSQKSDAADSQTQELKDDEIFLFGFSRGAFTVRVLTGLVLSQGLVHFASESDLEQKARAAYRKYRNDRFPRKNLEYPFRALRNLLATHTHNENERRVDRIRFIGVWDTVAAYGSPIDEITRGFSQWIWPLELPNTKLSDRIDKACQALAIDEERTTFAPVLWDESTPFPAGQIVSQVWFSGVHSNVGGGYPDDSLAKVSLDWMMAEAAACNLRFKTAPDADPDARKYIAAAQDKDGRLYDSRTGLGGYYRYGPRKICDYYSSREDGSKCLPKIHESVLARIQVGAHLYAPIGLPSEYAVVRADDRTVQPLGKATSETPEGATSRHAEQESVWNIVWRRRVIYFVTVFASLYIVIYPLVRESYAFQQMATRLRLASDTIGLIGAFFPSGASRWLNAYQRDPAWFLLWIGIISFLLWYASSLKSEINSRMRNIWVAHLPGISATQPHLPRGAVWRAAWYSFIGLLLYICIYPILPDWSYLRFPSEPDPQDIPWDGLIRTYSGSPVRLVIGAFLIVLFMPERAIERLRTSKLYQWVLHQLKFVVLPFMFAVLIVYGSFAIVSHVLFNVRDSFGAFCKSTTEASAPSEKTITFDSSLMGDESLCLSTGVFARRGERFSIRVLRDPPDQKWTFWGEPAFLSGQPIERLAWWKQSLMALAFPFRRAWDRPWGSIIVRYGPTGTEESFLDRDPPALNDKLVDNGGAQLEEVPEPGESLGEPWTARRDGEIYVYLNKPVLGFWGIETVISKYLIPNTGAARVTVSRR